jgi:hypothetical protein
MPHIGVKGLAARGAEDDFREDEETGKSMLLEEFNSVPGIECPDDVRHRQQGSKAGQGEGAEPDQHDRTKGRGNAVRSSGLKNEEGNGNGGGDYNQRRLIQVFHARNDQHTLYGGENRNGRGDDAVPQQQGHPQYSQKSCKGDGTARFKVG